VNDHMVLGSLVTDEKAIILVIILLLLCLVAIAGNGFITAALGVEWVLRRTLLPCDKLLVSLGASRFCLQWVVMAKTIYVLLYPTAFPYNPVLQFLAFHWLSVFYCVKIATFTHPVFLWLRHKLFEWVPWMLFGSVGLSSFTTILFFIGNHRIYQNYLRNHLQPWNVTGNSIWSYCEKFYLFPLKMITWTMSTAVFFICMILLITSLGRHMEKALLTTSGFREPSVQAHVKALLALLSFAMLFISYFLSLVFSAAGESVIYLCAAVHPIILLFSNRRLRAVLERCRSSRCGTP
uniref:Taste receptor type 2 n=1 Tax=Piliocolobus tephrosceles TaxID=591936 RepID=A0A8C9LW48_9PRIM